MAFFSESYIITPTDAISTTLRRIMPLWGDSAFTDANAIPVDRSWRGRSKVQSIHVEAVDAAGEPKGGLVIHLLGVALPQLSCGLIILHRSWQPVYWQSPVEDMDLAGVGWLIQAAGAGLVATDVVRSRVIYEVVHGH